MSYSRASMRYWIRPDTRREKQLVCKWAMRLSCADELFAQRARDWILHRRAGRADWRAVHPPLARGRHAHRPGDGSGRRHRGRSVRMRSGFWFNGDQRFFGWATFLVRADWWIILVLFGSAHVL